MVFGYYYPIHQSQLNKPMQYNPNQSVRSQLRTFESIKCDQDVFFYYYKQIIGKKLYLIKMHRRLFHKKDYKKPLMYEQKFSITNLCVGGECYKGLSQNELNEKVKMLYERNMKKRSENALNLAEMGI